MLKINKILSKKIKFPPSLRGAKRRSNLSGFSLIELMVAAAILAVAIFGIFHAYSVGFMGMADARDRTVATNYMREAMEDVKNTDFDKIKQTYRSVTNANKEYKIYVTFSTETDNLKEIFTIVEWKDRNGIKKTVESSMLVHFIEVFALDPAKIVLFADSYIILSNSTTNLTAAIKDIKGNTIIDWTADNADKNIIFSVIPYDKDGSFSNTSDTAKGIATTTFTHDGTVGTGEIDVYEVKASVELPNGSVVTDSVTIKVTDGPVKITLTADPPTIKSNSPDCSIITVSLQNAAGYTLKKNTLVSDVEITFSVFGDFVEGDLSYSTITIPTGSIEDDAVEEIELCPTSNRGLAIVIAKSTGLESGRADVKFLGPPVSILISANPKSIYLDDLEGSTITVSLIDKNGFLTNPISGEIAISLAISEYPGAELGTYSLIFNEYDAIGTVNTTNFINQSITGTAIITASAIEEVGLSAASVTINVISALIPDHIELTTIDPIVQAGGTSSITATVYDGSKIVTNYNGTITFKTTLGIFSNEGTTIIEDVVGGKATTVLSSSLDFPGIAIITIIDPAPTVLPFNPPDGLVVRFYGGAQHIKLDADPKYVKLNGANTSTITATVYDLDNIIVLDYFEDITFTNDGVGDFITPNPATADKGMAIIDLYYSEVGIAIITASEGGISSNSETVEFYRQTDIRLVENSAKYYPEDFKVTFEVIAIGENILVEGMQIFWEDDGIRLKYIVIGSDVVYTGNSLSSAILNFDEDKILNYETTYLIELTFGKNVAGKTFKVHFFTPTSPTGVFDLEDFTP